MTLGALLAAACVLIGFGTAVFEETWLFAPGTWFVAAIPLALLGGPVIVNIGGRHRA